MAAETGETPRRVTLGQGPMSLRSLSQGSAESEQLQQASVSHSGPGMKRGSQTWPLVTLGGYQEAPRGCGQHDFLHLWPFCASPGLSPHPMGTGNGGEMDNRRALPGPPSGLVSHSEGCRPEVRSGEACPSSTAHTGSGVRHALVSLRAPSGSPLQLHGTGQPGGCHVPAAEEQRGGEAGGAGPHPPPPPPRQPTVRGSRVGGLLSGATSTSWTSQSSKLGQWSEPRGSLRPRAGPRGNVAGRGRRQIGVLEAGSPVATWAPAGKSSGLSAGSRLGKNGKGATGARERQEEPWGGGECPASSPTACRRAGLWPGSPAHTAHANPHCYDTRSGINCTRRVPRNLPAARSDS